MTRERWDSEDILRDAVLYRMLPLGEIARALPDGAIVKICDGSVLGLMHGKWVAREG